MYYAAVAKNNTRMHCIGAATSSDVAGPYLPLDEAIVCDFHAGGVIDPAFVFDPHANKSYLVYKNDGNSIGVGGACSNTGWPNTPTPLMAMEISSQDLTTPVDKPFKLLSNLEVDGPNIEAPMLWLYNYHDEQFDSNLFMYHLTFSSGCFADGSYHIEHVLCHSNWLDDCDWGSLRGVDHGASNVSVWSRTLLETGWTSAKLYAPGGPSLNGRQLGAKEGTLAGDVDKEYMIFHGDVNMAYFEHPEVMSLEERIRNGWDRRRGMFVAKLKYDGQSDMLVVDSIVEPLRSRNNTAP
jgi:hypothetical protein